MWSRPRRLTAEVTSTGTARGSHPLAPSAASTAASVPKSPLPRAAAGVAPLVLGAQGADHGGDSHQRYCGAA